MSLTTLVARIASGETIDEIRANPARNVTPVTSCNAGGVTLKPAPALGVTPVTPVTAQNDNTQSAETASLESWEQWQAANPSPGNVKLTEGEVSHLRAWLAFIGETDPQTIADVLSTCERFPDTRAHCLREARTTKARQVIAARVAREAAEERAGILEHDAGLKRTDAERVAKLAEAFYNHLFAQAHVTGCCWAPRNRYCAEGLKFRDAYYDAAKAAGKLA